MAVWTTKYINDLPDSSFAYIADGGTKDSDGKTMPRDLRKLPYKNASGVIDPAHTRNALARLDQTDGIAADKKADVAKTLQNALAKANGKTNNDVIDGEMFRVTPVQLDATGTAPNRLMLMQTGDWPNSVKGNFKITLDHLKEVKANFDKGIGFPTEDTSTGLAIDFMHEYDKEAAGWVKGLELDINEATGEGKLYANPVEWTDAGAAAIAGGQFKCISPSGYFGERNKRLSMWANPNNLKEKVANVLDGAGLTNIPFLRGMTPIRADNKLDGDDSAYGNVIYVVDNQHKNKEQAMNLDALRVKDVEDLNGPEYKFLADNKEQLSADEQKKFSLETPVVDNKEELSDEDRATLSAIKDGSKQLVDADKEEVVDKERLDRLEKTAEQYRDEKATEVVELHVKRGAIKQDSADNWKKRLLSADEADRESLEADLKALPSNEALSKELGSAEDVNAGSTPREQLNTLANAKVAAAAKEGKELLYTDALKQVSRENPDLMKADMQNNKVGA